jgi:hypothetical protein
MFVRLRKHPINYVRFEVFTAVTMKSAVFWNVTPCDSCKNRRSGGTYSLHHQGDKNRRAKKTLAVTSNWTTLLIVQFILAIEAPL